MLIAQRHRVFDKPQALQGFLALASEENKVKEERKMEKEKVILTDGREVVDGPWIQPHPSADNRGFRMGICVEQPGIADAHQRKLCRENPTILEVKTPSTSRGIGLPSFQIFEQKLWTDELIRAVREKLRAENRTSKNACEYVATNLAAAFQPPKELKLPDGSKLLGDLGYTCSWQDDLQITGNIRDNAGGISSVTVFSATHIRWNGWPGAKPHPAGRKNEAIWCRGLEALVISYLELLARFSDSFFVVPQIERVLAELKHHSAWSATLRHLAALLTGLPPDRQDDPEIIQAIKALEEVCAKTTN